MSKGILFENSKQSNSIEPVRYFTSDTHEIDIVSTFQLWLNAHKHLYNECVDDYRVTLNIVIMMSESMQLSGYCIHTSTTRTGNTITIRCIPQRPFVGDVRYISVEV